MYLEHVIDRNHHLTDINSKLQATLSANTMAADQARAAAARVTRTVGLGVCPVDVGALPPAMANAVHAVARAVAGTGAMAAAHTVAASVAAIAVEDAAAAMQLNGASPPSVSAALRVPVAETQAAAAAARARAKARAEDLQRAQNLAQQRRTLVQQAEEQVRRGQVQLQVCRRTVETQRQELDAVRKHADAVRTHAQSADVEIRSLRAENAHLHALLVDHGAVALAHTQIFASRARSNVVPAARASHVPSSAVHSPIAAEWDWKLAARDLLMLSTEQVSSSLPRRHEYGYSATPVDMYAATGRVDDGPTPDATHRHHTRSSKRRRGDDTASRDAHLSASKDATRPDAQRSDLPPRHRLLTGEGRKSEAFATVTDERAEASAARRSRRPRRPTHRKKRKAKPPATPQRFNAGVTRFEDPCYGALLEAACGVPSRDARARACVWRLTALALALALALARSCALRPRRLRTFDYVSRPDRRADCAD